MEKKCFTCKKTIRQSQTFCNKECYFRRENYRQQTEETKKKIAVGNSKPMSEARKRAISKAKLFQPDEILLQKLHFYWSLRFLNPLVIKELCGLPRRARIYDRLLNEHCKIEQHKFMPSDWYPEDYQKLIDLANQGVWHQTIAKMLSSSLNQIVNLSKKLNLPINTHKPDPWSCSTSKLEEMVLKWIQEEGYEMTRQFQLGNFYFDAHITNTNILIEVNGDYWHCNPKVYVNGPINEMQKKLMRRDFAKKSCAKIKGYKLITVWENDVRKKDSNSKDWILGKIREYELHESRTNFDF